MSKGPITLIYPQRPGKRARFCVCLFLLFAYNVGSCSTYAYMGVIMGLSYGGLISYLAYYLLLMRDLHFRNISALVYLVSDNCLWGDGFGAVGHLLFTYAFLVAL